MSAKTGLGISARFAYALPAFALAIVGLPVYTVLPKFYTDSVGVSMVAVGGILAAVRIFDAVLDPLIGALSDRTRTRLGRRRPWIIGGSVPLAIALAALFAPVPTGEAAAVWFGVSIFALFFFFSVTWVPYESLGIELTEDYDDRTRLLGLRDAALLVGMGACVSAPLWIQHIVGLGPSAQDQRTLFAVMAAIYAPLLVLLCGGCALIVRERESDAPPPRSILDRATVKTIVANRPFIIVLTAYFVNAIGTNLPGILMPYYVKDYLRSDRIYTYLGAYFAIGVAMLPVWIWLSRRIGKKAAWLAAMTINSGSFFFAIFFGRDDERLYQVMVAVAGTGFGATWAIPSSMQADVLDYDELLSSERREGLLVGLWLILRKLAPALPVGIAFPALKAAGWAEGATDQTDKAFFALKMWYIVVPTICTAIAFLIALQYPIDREKHARILDALAARESGRPFTDPLAPLADPA
ncbi:MAG TPA: MFS transporter [Planctomycetota bacterium]|nr:MFS transporter [Planctomycetota bacterium]